MEPSSGTLRRLAAGIACVALVVEADPGQGLSDCPCINPYTHPSTTGISAVMSGNSVTYRPAGSKESFVFPSSWGIGCAAHDEGLEPYCNDDAAPGWCFTEWCYVNPSSCTGVTRVKARWLSHIGGLYFSYATCRGAGGSGTASSSPWDNFTIDDTKHFLRGINKFVSSAASVLEESYKDLSDTTTCTIDVNNNMCPCSSCNRSTVWDSQIDFFQAGIKEPIAGTPQERSAGTCMAERVTHTYKTIAALEMGAEFEKVGYQYFADVKTGAYAQFPKEDACDWRGANNDTWDPRYRDWFAAGATGPKDVILVVDVSGSMGPLGDFRARHEQALKATKMIIETLTWKDFVGIVLFDRRIEAVYKNYLVPATEANKRQIKAWCDRQDWYRGGTDFVVAFEKAFEIIKKSVFSSPPHTSMCQKVMMFLTDGECEFGTANYQYVQRQATRYDVFLFSYTIGDGADKTVAKKLACQNRGVHYHVPDSADLAGIMSKYYEYFAQGQEICQASLVKYGALSSSAMLWGACMPMYDRRSVSTSLLGVSCIDVTMLRDLNEMRKDAGWDYFVCQATDITKTCRSLDLSECHRQRVRLAYSSESVCTTADSADATFTGITNETETKCPCQDPSCQDVPDFRDELMFFCDNWIGDSCVDVDPTWGYSAAGIRAIQDNCKRSCNLCEWRDPCPMTAAAECFQVPVASECRACLGRTSGVDIEGAQMSCPPGSPRDLMEPYREKKDTASDVSMAFSRRFLGPITFALGLAASSFRS